MNKLVVCVTRYGYEKYATVLANQESTINGEDWTTVPKGLDTLREASESPEEYLTLPCVWSRDVLIMHAWIHRFDCIEKY
jgi:hypothetical protein